MRKLILLPACLACFGCGDGSSEVPPGGLDTRDLNNVSTEAPEPTDPAGSDTDVPLAIDTEVPAASTDTGSTDAAPASPANAGVTNVRAVAGSDSWTFHVTVDHPDTGWDDYADGWDVVLPDGKVIKPAADSPFTRLLLHPHENERPFTRSQSGIVIPAGVTSVTVRAHDLVDGFGGLEVVVDLESAKGQGFTVER